jgi:uncharacterized Fe-S cluster protein YjdI
MKDIIKKYTNGEVTVVWQPSKCVHSAICFRRPEGLPEVFNPSIRPWVNMQGAPSDQIIEHVKKCPSGALSFFINDKENISRDDESGSQIEQESERVVQVMKNGPLLIYGNITVKNHDGTETKRTKVTSFCRCGASKTNPYCDGTHMDIRFQG